MATFQSVSLATLRLGQVLSNPIYDPQRPSTKLLGAGIQVTEELVAKLRARGVRNIIIDERDLARTSSSPPEDVADRGVEEQGSLRLSPTAARQGLMQQARARKNGFVVETSREPTRNRMVTRTGSYRPVLMHRASSHLEETVAFGAEMVTSLLQSRGGDFEGLHTRCQQSIAIACEDISLYASLGINPFSSDYPSRHGSQVATIATAIGIIYGLDDQALVDLAIGCQLHDAGMLLVPKQLYELKRKLDEREFKAVTAHPDHTLRLLDGMEVSLQARLVVAQIHERCNGEGYPSGYKADEIHELAKIAAVADTFVALVSERPYRTAMQPYFAMLKILDGVKQGFFAPAVVRSLLQAVSLFPLGSYVALDGSFVGRVIRSNPERYDRPTIEMWNADATDRDPSVVDLAEESGLAILKPLASLPNADVSMLS